MIAAFLTDFADQAVVLPLALVLAVVLAATGWRRGALAWSGSIAGVLICMLVLKMSVLACGWRIDWHDLVSPSGHTATAAVVYGGLLALLLPGGRTTTLAAALLGGAMALLVGLTRLALHVHTVSDVWVGACVGVGGAIAMRALAGRNPRPANARPLALAALLVMALFHGRHMEAESHIRTAALEIWPLTLCRK